MSGFDWWSRKLNETYVKYDGQFDMVMDVEFETDEEDWGMSEWPEDYEDGIRLMLRNGPTVPLSNVAFEFPDDQWKILEGKAYYGQRDMTRANWQLAPTYTNFRVLDHNHGRPGNALYRQWLNTPPAFVFNRPRAFMQWPENPGPMQFSRDLVAIKDGAVYNLYYGLTRVGRAYLVLDGVKLEVKEDALPVFDDPGWGLRDGSTSVVRDRPGSRQSDSTRGLGPLEEERRLEFSIPPGLMSQLGVGPYEWLEPLLTGDRRLTSFSWAMRSWGSLTSSWQIAIRDSAEHPELIQFKFTFAGVIIYYDLNINDINADGATHAQRAMLEAPPRSQNDPRTDTLQADMAIIFQEVLDNI